MWGIGSDFKFLLAGFRDCIGAFGFGFGGWGLRVHFFPDLKFVLLWLRVWGLDWVVYRKTM